MRFLARDHRAPGIAAVYARHEVEAVMEQLFVMLGDLDAKALPVFVGLLNEAVDCEDPDKARALGREATGHLLQYAGDVRIGYGLFEARRLAGDLTLAVAESAACVERARHLHEVRRERAS